MAGIRKYILGLTKAEGRTSLMRINILVSALVKIASLAISLLMVPYTLNYINKEEFGIWMTISNIVYWFAFLDVGLGNGMRNYMAASVSEGDMPRAGRFFHTTMFLMTVIFGAAYLVAIAVLPFFDLTEIFNTNILSDEMLKKMLIVALTFTLLNFLLKNVGYIYASMQKYSVMDVINFLGHLLGFVAIVVLTYTSESNLFYLVIALTSIPVIVYALSFIPTFMRYPDLRLRKGSIDLKLNNQILGKSIGFFLIQITSCVVIFGSSNVFISHYCGPESVTIYNLAFKLFNLLIVGYTIVISPLWNGYTDAAVKGDWDWIRKTFNKALRCWLLSVIVGVILLFGAGLFFDIWLNGKIQIPFTVSLCTLLYVSMFNLNNCATYLINGLNVIRLQIYSSIVTTLLYVTVVSVLKDSFGLEGLIVCMAGSYLLMSIIHLLQCRLLITGKAKGIWNR